MFAAIREDRFEEDPITFPDCTLRLSDEFARPLAKRRMDNEQLDPYQSLAFSATYKPHPEPKFFSPFPPAPQINIGANMGTEKSSVDEISSLIWGGRGAKPKT